MANGASNADIPYPGARLVTCIAASVAAISYRRQISRASDTNQRQKCRYCNGKAMVIPKSNYLRASSTSFRLFTMATEQARTAAELEREAANGIAIALLDEMKTEAQFLLDLALEIKFLQQGEE